MVLTTWQVDVLRFLPLGTVVGQPNYGKRLVNDTDLANHGKAPHSVSLPDSGTGNQLPETAGAGIVAVYRHPDSPLTGIVLWEGFRFKPAAATMSQTLYGYYQRADGAVGKLTQFVSSGQPNPSEQFKFNNAGLTTQTYPQLSNPFNSSPSSQRGFRALELTGLNMGNTFPGASYPVKKSQWRFSTAIISQEECLAWSAFQFSVPVKDTDRDGLLNIWESSQAANLLDPADNQPIPNL